MRLYRCFAPGAHQPGAVVELAGEEARHLAAARRVEKGRDVLLLDGRGAEYRAETAEVARQRVALTVHEVLRRDPPPPATALAWSLTKSAAFDDIFTRAVELGMTDFLPLHAQHGDVTWEPRRWEKKRPRYERLAIEALKQCERTWLPRIHDPADLRGALSIASGQGWTPILLHERADAPPLPEVLARAPEDVLLCIGPEGGWTEEESNQAAAAGAHLAHLGRDAILRTETAVMAALAAGGHARRS